MNNLFRGIAASLLLGVSGPSMAQDVKMRFGDGGMSNDSVGVVHPNYLAERASKLSGGRFKIETFHHAVLGDEIQMVQQVQQGSLQAVFIGNNNMTSRVPEFLIFSLPYMFNSIEEGYRLQDKGWDAMNNWAIQRAGVRVLAQECMGFRAFFNTKQPINAVADLKGLKWRVPPDRVLIANFKAWGVNPSAIPWNETFNALAQGVVDGGANPYDDIVTAKLYEVAKYITPMHDHLLCHMLLFSEPFFQRLAKKDQEIITKAGIESTEYIREWTGEHEKQQLAFLQAQPNIKFNKPSDEGPFRRLAVKNWPLFYKEVGGGDEKRGAQIVTEAAEIAKGKRAGFSRNLFLK